MDARAGRRHLMQRLSSRLLALIACLAVATPALADDNFRCGSKLVMTGMTQAEVLQLCGPPMSKAEETVPVRSGNQVVGETTTHRWTYESYGATRVLVFDRDVLSPSNECRRDARCPDDHKLLELRAVRGVIGWMGAFLAGSAGWWLGAKVGLGAAVVLGAVASGAGLYAGNRWFDQNLK